MQAVQHDPIHNHRRHYRRHIIRGGSGPGNSARWWAVSNVELKKRIIELMSERNATGVAIDNAIIGNLPEQHPMMSRLQVIAKLAAQRDQLLASLKELLSSKAETGLFAGVMAADNAAKLIKSIEDGEWIGADHSPDAGKMVPDGFVEVASAFIEECAEAKIDFRFQEISGYYCRHCSLESKSRDGVINGEHDTDCVITKVKSMLAAAPTQGGE